MTLISPIADSYRCQGPDAPELLRDERLHEQFVATARRQPDAIALCCGGQDVTYGALHALTDAWSEQLRAIGIGPGCTVGIWLTRSIALHAAVLAVLKAGATYLPFDENAPADRVATCLADCGASLILVDAIQAERAAGLGACVLNVAALDGPMPDGHRSNRAERPPATQAAYIIYTSGSTGRPKGVAVSHASICHLTRAENALLGICDADRVYAGFSAAFDMSLEEVFIAYLVGASLLVATTQQVQQLDHLPGLLRQAGVSVLHCVPTMLAMLDGDVPGLRLINLGGEACPASLVQRWWRPDRRMTNTYGPTEATVTATLAELRPGEPVTIGSPLPNYTVMIVDEAGLPVPADRSGELCIGGPGVSLGYVNRPELTAAVFVPVPGLQSLAYPLMYRTGDRASVDSTGHLILHGRFDDQVKHRGFRIELGEIEAELTRLPGVRAAAVVLRGGGAAEHLAAYVVADPCDPRALRAALAERLPSYMVPLIVRPVPALPQLPSGKTDRKALPHHAPPEPAEMAESEDELLVALQALFPHARVGRDDDFFRDLGGHSLLAAVLVSRLRKLPRFARLSLQDLYELRTARRLDERFAATETSGSAAEAFRPTSRWQHAGCTLAQACLLPIVFALASTEFLVPYLAFDQAHDRFGWLAGTGAALAAFVAIPPMLMAVAVTAKWLVLGRVEPGRHPLWGWYYLRWWFVGRLLDLVNMGMFADTPLMASYYRLLGARIGKDAHLGMLATGAHDLVEVGAGSSIGSQVLLNTASVEGGWLIFGPVRIGADAYVGSACVLDAGSTVGDGGELANLSLLRTGATIPDHQRWTGSPAAPRGPASPGAPAERAGPARRRAALLGFALVGAILLPILHLLPMLPSLGALEFVQQEGPGRRALVLLSPIIALAYTVMVLGEVTILRWLVLGRVRPGEHGTTSSFFLRKWIVDRLMELSLAVLHPIYATLYIVPVFRGLGAKVGRGAEISTASALTHDLLEIGDGAFVADMVTLGDPEIRRGRLTLRHTVVGKRTFIGNCALVPDGSHLPDDALVGCLSVPPDETLRPGQACLGSPAIILPSRQQSTCYDARLTFRPGAWQIAQRLFIEGARILLPRGAVFAAICLALDAFETLPERLGYGPALLMVPLLYLTLFCAPGLLGIVTIKWALVGRYRPAEYPMWSRPVWLSEAVTAIYEGLTVPLLLRHLRGTAFLPMALRLFGAQIGRRVWMDTTDLTEFDLVTIGDEAELNQHGGPQTHLFEDRVMKMDALHLGARSTLGAHSIALPGARLADGARLGSLSLIMKGETIPAGPSWAGSPARRQ